MSSVVKAQFPVLAEMEPATMTNKITSTFTSVKILLNRADSFTPKHKIAEKNTIKHQI